jgi:hypothetical protein
MSKQIPHASQLEKLLKKFALDLKPDTLFTYKLKAYTVKSAKPIANGTKLAVQTTTKMIVLSLTDIAEIKIVESDGSTITEKKAKTALQRTDSNVIIVQKTETNAKIRQKLQKSAYSAEEDADVFMLSTKDFCEKWNRSPAWLYQRRWQLSKNSTKVSQKLETVKQTAKLLESNTDTSLRSKRHTFTEAEDALILANTTTFASRKLGISYASIYQRKNILHKKLEEQKLVWMPKQHDIATVEDGSIEVAITRIVHDCKLALCQVVKSKDSRWGVGLQFPIPVRRLRQLATISI